MKSWLFIVIAALASCDPPPDPGLREAALRGYIEAVNRNAVSEALAFHTPDAEFQIPGQGTIQGLEAMRSLLQWDSVLGSRIRFEPLNWRGDTLVVSAGAERNAWFAGIGVDSIQYTAGTRFVFEGDRIRGVYPASLEPESLVELEARFGAFWRWAETNAPEAARLAPEGLFQYNAEAAQEWLDIFARYQDEGGF